MGSSTSTRGRDRRYGSRLSADVSIHGSNGLRSQRWARANPDWRLEIGFVNATGLGLTIVVSSRVLAVSPGDTAIDTRRNSLRHAYIRLQFSLARWSSRSGRKSPER